MLHVANMRYGRLSILTVPRFRDRHLRRLNIGPTLMDHRVQHRVHGAAKAEERKPQTRLSRCRCSKWHLLEQDTATFWEHLFNEVTRHDEGRFVSTTDEAGDGSSGRGRLLLWECDATACGDGKEGTAVHGQDPGTQHAKSSPLSALSRPTNFGAEESQQRLVLQGHDGPAPWE
jgi:hypothetical protein